MASKTNRKRKMKLSLTTKKALSGWFFVLPFVIGILVFYGPIIVQSLKFAFSDVAIKGGKAITEPAGFDNFVQIFNSPDPDRQFSVTLVDGFQDLLLQIPAIVIFSLFIAIILNQKMPGRTVFRAIFFLPVILNTGIIDAIDAEEAAKALLESASSGQIDDGTGATNGLMSVMDLQNMLGNIKIGTGLVTYVVELVNGIFDIVSRSGVQMLIFLSGLQSISPSIYESCQVEGASAWETFWKITLPMISPMILVNFIYTIIDTLTSAGNRVMNFIEMMGGRPLGEGIKVTEGHLSAMYWMYIMVVLLLIVVVVLLMKTFVYYQRRD